MRHQVYFRDDHGTSLADGRELRHRRVDVVEVLEGSLAEY